jgi:hypothetical protein
MLAFLANLGIGSIVGKLADAYRARETAKTDEQRIQADRDIAMLQAQAAAQKPIDAWVRIGFALPFVVYNAKLVLWDKLFCSTCSTDLLGANLTQVEMVVIGFYFIHSMVKG